MEAFMAGIGSAVIAVKVLTWASIIDYIGVAGVGIFAFRMLF